MSRMAVTLYEAHQQKSTLRQPVQFGMFTAELPGTQQQHTHQAHTHTLTSDAFMLTMGFRQSSKRAVE